MIGRKKKGQSLTEAGLVLSLVAVVGISSLTQLGEQLKTNFASINDRLDEAIQVSTGNQGTGTPPPPADPCDTSKPATFDPMACFAGGGTPY